MGQPGDPYPLAVSAGRGGGYLCRCPFKALRSPVGTLFGTGGILSRMENGPYEPYTASQGRMGFPGLLMCLFSGCICGTGWSPHAQMPRKGPQEARGAALRGRAVMHREYKNASTGL